MNFDEAIKVHTYWKLTLRWMINGDHPVDQAETADAHHCELGRWIDNEGACYAGFPEFQRLISEHAEFHRIAAEVVSHIQNGENGAAEAMLAPDGDFTRASTRTIDAIQALKAQVSATG